MDTFSIKINDKEYKYKIIKTLSNKKLNHNYIIYSDGKEIYSSRYTIKNDDVILEDIESEEEWDFIDNYIEKTGGEI